MAKNLLKFEPREGTGKSVTRKLRKEGKIPAIVYGRGEESFPITVEAEEFADLLSSLRGKLLLTELSSPEGETFRAAIKAIQRHPVTEEFLNIDFQKIHPGEMLHVSIPIITHGTPVGLKMGGLLEQVRYEVDVRGPVAKLPLHMDVDITPLEVGDAVRVSDLEFDEEVEVLDPPQGLIVSIITPRKERLLAAGVEGEAEEAEAAGEEGEAAETAGESEEKSETEESKE